MNKEITDRKKESSAEREDKQSRLDESRLLELHEVHKRAIMNMEYDNPLYVDPAVIPPGMEYRWVRESVRDQPDPARMVDCRKKGWVPVPADRHPDLCFQDFFGRTQHMRSFIFYKGLVLCERRAELGKLERQKYADMNYQNMVSLQGTDNYMGEASIPVRNNSQTYVTKTVTAN
jgi:hypothetical protein